MRTINPVAPHAGAWIETLEIGHLALKEVVAPHAGAWIETMPAGVVTDSV